MAKKAPIEEVKEVKKVSTFSKSQIIKSVRFKDFYILTEILKDDESYTVNDVKAILKKYGKDDV